MDYYDIEELAAVVLGFSDDREYSSDIIDEGLDKRFEISFDQFKKIVKALIPFTIPAKSPLTGEMWQGFVNDGAFIVKEHAK
jgi:peroxiredoxin